MQRIAQGSHHPGADTRLLLDLAGRTLLDPLAAFEVPLGQVPAAVAADHQPLAAIVDHHAARRLYKRELRGKGPERRPGIGRDDSRLVVRFENFRYLRS